jgi:molecular chaperone DnaJ
MMSDEWIDELNPEVHHHSSIISHRRMDLYILLGVTPTATVEDIKRAYRRLARKYHPDINPGDRAAAAQFREIADAYETLSDPERRRQYDAVGARPEPAEREVTFGFQGFDFSVSVDGTAAPTFGDLFADVFQGRADRERGDGPLRGADLHQTLTLPFEDALRGGTWPVTVTREQACEACGGRGTVPGPAARCAHCHGTGAVRSARGHMVFAKPCAACGGTGVRGEPRCPRCQGRRLESRVETLSVVVPPGIADGSMLRLAGRGHAAAGGGGDLLIAVRVLPHPRFHRDGDDLHVTVPIGIDEAALGARIEVPSLQGSAKVRVPPGTQSGQRFRVRERGVASMRGGPHGDLVVEVRVALPATLDERSKELLREFGRLNPSEQLRTGGASRTGS